MSLQDETSYYVLASGYAEVGRDVAAANSNETPQADFTRTPPEKNAENIRLIF